MSDDHRLSTPLRMVVTQSRSQGVLVRIDARTQLHMQRDVGYVKPTQLIQGGNASGFPELTHEPRRSESHVSPATAHRIPRR